MPEIHVHNTVVEKRMGKKVVEALLRGSAPPTMKSRGAESWFFRGAESIVSPPS